MNRLSLKNRMTILITTLMTVLVVITVGFVFLNGKAIIYSQTKKILKRAVYDDIEDLSYSNNVLQIDDDFDYFDDDIYISIYDKEGKLLYGEQPKYFPQNQSLAANEINYVKINNKRYYYYDLLVSLNSDKQVYIRGITSSKEDNIVSQSLIIALFTLPIFIIISILLSRFIMKKTFTPINKIIDVAKQIERDNDLSKRINLEGCNDEIHTIANTFDSMFDRLEETFIKEKQFSSDASHELRTPTSVIISQCELSLENPNLDDETRQALNTILWQSKKMSSLINQLLTLARNNSNSKNLNIESICISDLCEIICDQQQEIADSKNINIHTDITPDLYLSCDETMMMSAILNLISNAIRYGKIGGFINFSLKQIENNIVCKVTDNGIGIDKKDIDKIWERFYRVDSSRTNVSNGEYDGTGLGLPMVKWIIESHKGSINVESKLNSGTTFTFSIPIS